MGRLLQLFLSGFLLSAFYIVSTKDAISSDDISISCLLVFCTYVTLKSTLPTARCLLGNLARKFLAVISTYGWQRVATYAVLAVFITSIVVTTLMMAALFTWDVLKNSIMSRFEDSIISVTEDRNEFEKVMIHPVTQGQSDPALFHQLSRYRMEDAMMTCMVYLTGFSGGRPFEDQIVWRLNGVPLKYTDRHTHRVNFRELSENETTQMVVMKWEGFSVYEVKATLRIEILQGSDFGSYTCHAAKSVYFTIKKQTTPFFDSMKVHNREARHPESHTTSSFASNFQCTQTLEPLYFFQDEYTWKEEFRLIELPPRQEIIQAPPGAILSIKTRYWHLSRSDDVEIDYSVNNEPYYSLCPAVLNGCSGLLLFYWRMSHDLGIFGIPPLKLSTLWKIPSFPANEFQMVHCLCQNSYGYHQVVYNRRYYNRTTNREDLIEIVHPHEFVVVPRSQDMFDLFVNRSLPMTVPWKPLSGGSRPGKNRDRSNDVRSMKEFAEVFLELFQFKESRLLVVLTVFLLLLVLLLWLLYRVLYVIHKKLWYYIMGNKEAIRCSAPVYNHDCFLSYSDEHSRIVILTVLHLLENIRFSVFFKERDIMPGHSTISDVSEAIENSNKFILFLSEEYLQDCMCIDFEAHLIFDVLAHKQSLKNALIIKLGPCEIPRWLKRFPVHDWTDGVSLENRLRNIILWIHPEFSRLNKLKQLLSNALKACKCLYSNDVSHFHPHSFLNETS